MANTRRDSLLFTALSAEQIDHAMSGCPSRQQVLILDCCYSGAFPASRLAKADTDAHALDRFRGQGRTVLTASDALQYSFEGNQPRGEAAQSVFTRYLVAGLRDGSADLDGDGNITLDELYSYVYDRVVEEIPQQRPKKQDNVEGRTIIARNINWSLPAYLHNALRSPIATDRLGALDGLGHLYRIGNDVVRACVRDEIQRLTDDDSRMVSSAAVERLRSILPQPLDVSKPEVQQAPESPAARATTPPARQTGSSVPAVVSARPHDPTFPTTVQQWVSAAPGRGPGSGAPGTGQLPGPLADFGARAHSFLIDAVAPFTVFVAVVIFAAAAGPKPASDTFIAAVMFPDALGLIAFASWNSGYRQGTTGQSLGRRVTKTKLVKIETGKPIGFGMALLRQYCVAVTLGIGFVTHGIGFLIGLLNYLWPLWDPKRQTVTDKVVKVVVVRINDPTT